MPDCFISYSSHEEELAEFVYAELESHNLDVFMASISLSPGEDWSPKIRQNLNASPWVIFLASKTAAQSPYVQQELGMALGKKKTLVPIVWDIAPGELPGWVSEKHAIDLRGASVADIRQQVADVAGSIRAEKQKGWMIVGGVILGLMAFGNE